MKATQLCIKLLEAIEGCRSDIDVRIDSSIPIPFELAFEVEYGKGFLLLKPNKDYIEVKRPGN